MNTNDFPPPWGISPETMAAPDRWLKVAMPGEEAPAMVLVFDPLRMTGGIFTPQRQRWTMITPISASDFTDYCTLLLQQAGLKFPTTGLN